MLVFACTAEQSIVFCAAPTLRFKAEGGASFLIAFPFPSFRSMTKQSSGEHLSGRTGQES